jgi:UDPglucose 6-dehydrogenase
MRLTMVGTGYVGLVTGVCFADSGNHVICLDVNEQKIAQLNAGVSPIYEPGLEEMIRRNVRAGRLQFTTDRRAAYQLAEMIFICVGTPSDEQGRADLRYVEAAASDIADAMNEGPADAEPKIIVIKSTVPVGTNAHIHRLIAERTDRSFTMASNPEFLKEGDAIRDFTHPDRVVVGADDKVTGEQMRELYEPFVRQGNPIFIMDIPSAEMVKYASNAMLATKISFVNEIASLCEAMGADIDEVRRGMCADRRIGNQFLFPGLGYGGSCFPKDVLACLAMGSQSNTPTDLLNAVHQVNQRQRETFLAKILQHFGDQLSGKRLAVWGIAFKPGTDDIREAPSLTLIKALLERGASVAAYDPVAADNARQELDDSVRYFADMMDVLNDADALIICTNWGEFLHPDFEAMHQRMAQPVIFDGRNLYRPHIVTGHGFTYYCVGRTVAGATEPARASGG